VAADHLTPLERRLLDTVDRRGDMHGRQLAAELGVDSGAAARCLVRLEQLGWLESTTLGRTKVYRVKTAESASLDTVLERIEHFSNPSPIAVLPYRLDGSAEVRVIVVLPGEAVELPSWLELRRLARGMPAPVELLIYAEAEARRLATVPGTPVREALKGAPERGARLME
jgi:hypothetical protein